MTEQDSARPMLFTRDRRYVSYRCDGNQRFGPYQLDELIVYYRCQSCSRVLRPSYARFCLGFDDAEGLQEAAVRLHRRASRSTGCEHCEESRADSLHKECSYFFHYAYFACTDLVVEVREADSKPECRFAAMDASGAVRLVESFEPDRLPLCFDAGLAEFRRGYAAVTFHSKLGEAKAHYTRALFRHPVFPEAEIELARLSMKWGNYSDAREHVEQAARLGAPGVECRILEAEVCLHERNHARVQSICREILVHNPDEAEAYFLRGISYLQENKRSLAVRDFVEALRLDSAHAGAAKALKNLGVELPPASPLGKMQLE